MPKLRHNPPRSHILASAIKNWANPESADRRMLTMANALIRKLNIDLCPVCGRHKPFEALKLADTGRYVCVTCLGAPMQQPTEATS